MQRPNSSSEHKPAESQLSATLGRLVNQLADSVAVVQSRRWLGVMERQAAKRLWRVSGKLNRAATRLDAVGLAHSLRDGNGDAAARAERRASGGKQEDFVDDEICAPHLA